MTNEETIKALRLLQSGIEWECPIEWSAAIDRAIEALEKPEPGRPADDTISRQAVLDLFETGVIMLKDAVVEGNALETMDRTITQTKKWFAECVMELPSAQLEACEYYALCRHGRDENKLRARLGVCEYCNEDFDGYVKPIEKNNHAFVRFGMNGWELSLKANGWHGSAKIRYCPMCGRELKHG